MARFIEVTQVNPGVGKMTVNVDYIIKFEKSGHADGGTSILVKADAMQNVLTFLLKTNPIFITQLNLVHL